MSHAKSLSRKDSYSYNKELSFEQEQTELTKMTKLCYLSFLLLKIPFALSLAP
jgi:hypothetical protein